MKRALFSVFWCVWSSLFCGFRSRNILHASKSLYNSNFCFIITCNNPLPHVFHNLSIPPPLSVCINPFNYPVDLNLPRLSVFKFFLSNHEQGSSSWGSWSLSPPHLYFQFSHTTFNYTDIKNSSLFFMNIRFIRNNVKKTTPSSGIYIRYKVLLSAAAISCV
jgi:hypothetical protein